MRLPTSLSVLTASALTLAMVPMATLAASSSSSSMYASSWSSSSSSSVGSMWPWGNGILNMNANGSANANIFQSMTTPFLDCTYLNGDTRNQCMGRLGLTMGSGSWLNGNMDMNLLMNNCVNNAICTQQQLNAWISFYSSYRASMKAMDERFHTMMQNAGMNDAQIQGIMNGTLNIQTAGNTTTGANSQMNLRDAWKVCSKFQSRTQARCMRDAMNDNQTGTFNFRQWMNLDSMVNVNDNNQ